jgi:hypothetical protein
MYTRGRRRLWQRDRLFYPELRGAATDPSPAGRLRELEPLTPAPQKPLQITPKRGLHRRRARKTCKSALSRWAYREKRSPISRSRLLTGREWDTVLALKKAGGLIPHTSGPRIRDDELWHFGHNSRDTGHGVVAEAIGYAPAPRMNQAALG